MHGCLICTIKVRSVTHTSSFLLVIEAAGFNGRHKILLNHNRPVHAQVPDFIPCCRPHHSCRGGGRFFPPVFSMRFPLSLLPCNALCMFPWKVWECLAAVKTIKTGKGRSKAVSFASARTHRMHASSSLCHYSSSCFQKTPS